MARYLVAGGNGNWNSTTNWSASDGGASGASFPVNGDDVHFTTASANANMTVNTASACTSISIEGTYAGTLTFNSTLTVAGTVTLLATMTIAGTSDLIVNTTATLTSGGKTLTGGLQIKGTSQTFTLVGNWIVTGTLTLSGTTAITVNWTTSETITCGGLTMTTATSGTAGIIMSGGTWSGSGVLKNNLSFAGNVTVSGSVAYNTGTLTYTSGTITTTGSTLTISLSTTLNTAGIIWNNIASNASITLTINSLLSISGTLNLLNSATYVFAGTAGFTCATFTNSIASAATITLVNGVTYTITTAFTMFTTRNGSILLFNSASAGNQAKINLAWGATCNVLASFTDIDASLGQPITTFNGTLSNTKGIVSQTNSAPISWNTPVPMLNLPVTKFGREGRRFRIVHN